MSPAAGYALKPHEFVISHGAAARQQVARLELEPYQLRQLQLPALEVLTMPTVGERDLLFSAAIAAEGWGRYRDTTPYRMTVCFLSGPSGDGIAAVLDVALECDPARRPDDATGTGIVRHECDAVLARVPDPAGYRLEVLHRSADGVYSRADTALRALLIAIDAATTIPIAGRS